MPKGYISAKHRLCFIDQKSRIAYFAPVDPTAVRGEDWNDAPYERNAEVPHAFVSVKGEYVRDESADIRSLVLNADWVRTPADLTDRTVAVPYAVEHINAGEVPWLTEAIWSTAYHDAGRVQPLELFAGATMVEFVEFAKLVDATVYIPLDEI